MDRTNTSAAAPPASGMPDARSGYAEAARGMLWAVESTQLMLDMNRKLFDLSRDVLRGQQDAVIAATRRALGGSGAPDRMQGDGGLADLARFTFQAYERMASTILNASNPARWAEIRAEAERRASSRPGN
jgi:hypothetical protein